MGSIYYKHFLYTKHIIHNIVNISFFFCLNSFTAAFWALPSLPVRSIKRSVPHRHAQPPPPDICTHKFTYTRLFLEGLDLDTLEEGHSRFVFPFLSTHLFASFMKVVFFPRKTWMVFLINTETVFVFLRDKLRDLLRTPVCRTIFCFTHLSSQNWYFYILTYAYTVLLSCQDSVYCDFTCVGGGSVTFGLWQL